MFEYMLVIAVLFFCAGVGMWLCLLMIRAANVLLSERRRGHRTHIVAAMSRLRVERDPRSAIDELGRADPAALIQISARMLRLSSPAERQSFEAALAQRRLEHFITNKMGRANETMRLLYCEQLGTLASARSIAALREAISDRSPAVRVAAAISLAGLGEAGDIRVLLDQLGADARRSARLTYLFDRLARDRPAETVEIAEDSTLKPRVRICAFLALIRASEAGYIEFVPKMAADPEPELAAASVRQLLQGPHPDAAALMESLLASDSLMVRREASEGAARLKDKRLVQALRIALHDRDPIVHARAARSLFELARTGLPGRDPGPALLTDGSVHSARGA